MSSFYLYRDQVSLHGLCHVAPPCFYGSLEQTDLALVRAFHNFKFGGQPVEMAGLEEEEEEAAVSPQSIWIVRC